MEKKLWGLIVLLCFFSALSTAQAEERIVPKGTTLETPSGARFTLDKTYFLLSRASVDRANASRAAETRLEKSLKDCQRDLITATERKKPEKTSKLVTYGAALGIAFATGVALGVAF